MPARRRSNPKSNSGSLSVRERAYAHIQELITNGSLRTGSGISELGLARDLGSSRTPIREAMNQLSAEGLLAPSASGGMTVAQLTREDIVELYELREALEVYAVNKAASLPMRPADRDRLQHMVDRIALILAELRALPAAEFPAPELNAMQMQHFLAADLGFHALLMSMAGNSRIQKILRDTRLLIRIFALNRRGHDLALLKTIHAAHQRILDAVAEGRGADAMQALAEHIQISQRERLNEFDYWNREADLRLHHPGLFEEKFASVRS